MRRRQDLWQRGPKARGRRTVHEDPRRRSFLHGHLFGDNVHDICCSASTKAKARCWRWVSSSPCPNSMACGSSSRSAEALQAAGIKKPTNPAHLWKIRAIIPYAKWMVGEKLRWHSKPTLPTMPPGAAGASPSSPPRLCAARRGSKSATR